MIFGGLVGLLILFALLSFFGAGFRLLRKLLINGLLGWLLLAVINIVAEVLGSAVRIPVDFWSAVLAGVFGLPYIVLRLLMR